MTTYVAVFALVLGYAALVAAYMALRTLARLRQASAVLARGARGPNAQESLIEANSRTAEQLAVLAEEVGEMRTYLTSGADSDAVPGGLRNVALVRYDAFGEMSGRMSFSLALLDDKGDGVAISAIAGATDTRVYAKGITDGKGEHDLSPEEQQAVAAALRKRRGLLLRKSA